MVLDVIAKVLALVFLVVGCAYFVRAAARIMPDENDKESCAKRPPTRGYWRRRKQCHCAACRVRKGAMGVQWAVAAEMTATMYATNHEIAQRYVVSRAASTD